MVCVTSVSGAIEDQERKVTGKVTDNSGSALIGVSVVVKGTTTGIITDLEGNYSLAIPQDGTTLSFSFVGITSQDVLIGNQGVINIILTEDAVGLEEVVVIGYGTVKRKDLTGSVSLFRIKNLLTDQYHV